MGVRQTSQIPLTAINVYAELLPQAESERKRIAYMENVQQSIGRMKEILDNNSFFYSNTKIYKKTDFLRPVNKKVKTAIIFVVKTRSQGFPILICPTGLVSQ